MDTQLDEAIEVITEKDKKYVIVLYNDDVNTFDHVIDCLVKICKHQVLQAEQCANIVHFNGKCQVNDGPLEEMKIQCTALLNEQLSAKVEDKN